LRAELFKADINVPPGWALILILNVTLIDQLFIIFRDKSKINWRFDPKTEWRKIVEIDL